MAASLASATMSKKKWAIFTKMTHSGTCALYLEPCFFK
jgi:hypothetical protein